jgi:CHAD domain-containing protein
MSLDQDRLLKPARKLRKVLKNISKDPAPKLVHSLRTNTRRLEATLAAVSLNGLTGEKKLLKKVARIRKKAGKVQDMDVLTSFAAGLKSERENDCRVELLEHLGAERKRQAKKLHRTVTKQVRAVRTGLKRVSTELEEILCVDGNPECDPNQARGQAAASALKMESKLSDPPRLTRANLHPYRLKVKELHNVLRMAEKSDGEEFVESLNSVKDAIGEWHDWEELLAISKEILAHSNCKLLRELRTIAEQKYERALSQAESMRRKYLRTDARKRYGTTTERAWKVTAGLAA